MYFSTFFCLFFIEQMVESRPNSSRKSNRKLSPTFGGNFLVKFQLSGFCLKNDVCSLVTDQIHRTQHRATYRVDMNVIETGGL